MGGTQHLAPSRATAHTGEAMEQTQHSTQGKPGVFETLVLVPVGEGPGGGHFAWEIPDGWQQGRGAYGGLVIAALVQAANLTVNGEGKPPERPVRSVTAELPGPALVGACELKVETLRAGSGMSTVAVRLIQKGEVLAHAVVILGRSRVQEEGWVELSPPWVPPWRELAVMDIPGTFAPTFTQHFEYRLAGPIPYSGQEEAQAMVWMKPRQPIPPPEMRLIALSDTVWPSCATRFEQPRPMATVSYTLEIVGDFEGLDPAAPLLHHGRTVVNRHGFTVEFRELWGEDGRLLALNQQTIVLIR